MLETNFDFLLSRVLAHSIVYEWKCELSPNGIVDDAVNGGDPPPMGTQESTAQQLAAYTQGLPDLLKVTAGTALPVGQQLLDAQKTLAPQQNELLTSLFKQYGPELAGIGDTINSNSAKSAAGTAADIAKGSGSDLFHTIDALQHQADPEYYKNRSEASGKLSELLSSFNMNGLSGGERSEIERSNAQQDAQRGSLTAPSQTATVNNAMNFGSGFAQKQQRLAQAIGTATSFLPSAQGNVNASAIVTGAPAGAAKSNPGLTQFAGVQPVGSESFSSGNNFMQGINNTATNNANITANMRDSLDRVNGTLGALPT